MLHVITDLADAPLSIGNDAMIAFTTLLQQMALSIARIMV